MLILNYSTNKGDKEGQRLTAFDLSYDFGKYNIIKLGGLKSDKNHWIPRINSKGTGDIDLGDYFLNDGDTVTMSYQSAHESAPTATTTPETTPTPVESPTNPVAPASYASNCVIS